MDNTLYTYCGRCVQDHTASLQVEFYERCVILLAVGG